MPGTILDVAKLAQVSKKTVSRVINNEGTVAHETRERVLMAIEKLAYSPNPWAQSLARGKSSLIALVFDDAASSYVMSVLNGLMASSESDTHYGISVLKCNPDDPQNIQSVIKFASHHQADGMIITPPCDGSVELLNGLSELNFPFVLLTPHQRTDRHAWVVANDEQGSYESAQHVISLGHRRIAYIQGNPRHQASWDRLNGYLRAMREHGLPIYDGYVQQGQSWSFEAGVQCTQQILQLNPAPTAIVTGGDEIAAGAIQTAFSMGLRLPDDLSIVGFDDSPLARQLWPPLTTIRQPIHDIAATALHILVEGLIIDKELERHVVIPTELVVRQSTARCPSDAK
jgi:LacI family transcriptional regulator